MNSSKRFVAVAAVLIFISNNQLIAADEEESTVVSELSLKGLKGVSGERGRADKPTVIKNNKELGETISEEAVLERIKMKVDFDKQELVFFKWAGSGRDQIEAKVVKEDNVESVVFKYSRGRTRDLRRHAKLFVVNKDVKWSVSTGR